MFAFGRMFMTLWVKFLFVSLSIQLTPGGAHTGIGSYSIGLYLLSCVEFHTVGKKLTLKLPNHSFDTAANVIVSLRCKGVSWNLKGCWPHGFLWRWLFPRDEEIYGEFGGDEFILARMFRRSYWLWVISLLRDTSLQMGCTRHFFFPLLHQTTRMEKPRCGVGRRHESTSQQGQSAQPYPRACSYRRSKSQQM